MLSDLIGKIDKARRYAAEPERIAITSLRARFHGSNHDHLIEFTAESGSCDCTVFRRRGTCAHIMTLQKLLDPMLTAATAPAQTMHSDLISMIEKSRHYAHEPERVAIETLEARFQGSNNGHIMTLGPSGWACDCETFRLHRTCAHNMALERLLEPMLQPELEAAA